MLTVEFPNGETVNAIILDGEPQDKVIGIVDCAKCETRMTLTGEMTEQDIVDAIKEFALNHDCMATSVSLRHKRFLQLMVKEAKEG